MPSVMTLFGALGGVEDDRAACDVQRRRWHGPWWSHRHRRDASPQRRPLERGWLPVVGDRPRSSRSIELDGRRYVEDVHRGSVTAVARPVIRTCATTTRSASRGPGPNLRALVRRHPLGRTSPRTSFSSSPIVRAPRSTGRPSRGSTRPSLQHRPHRMRPDARERGCGPPASWSPAPDSSAGRVHAHPGPGVLAAFPGGSSTPTPACCRRSRAPHAVREALAYGVKVTGCTVHLVDEEVDRGPIVAVPGGRPVEPGDDEGTAPRADQAGGAPPAPAGRRLLLEGRVQLRAPARVIEAERYRGADAAVPRRRRALVVSDKTGLASSRRAGRLGLEIVSTGGTARALATPASGDRRRGGHRLPRDARRAREDAPPEDPRRLLAAAAVPEHRAALPGTASPPSTSSSSTSIRSPRPPRVPASRRRTGRGDRHRRPAMIRAAAKNQPPWRSSRADPLRRCSRPSTTTAAIPLGLRRALAIEAFATPPRTTPGSPPSCRAGWCRRHRPAADRLPRGGPVSRRSSRSPLEKVETLRYGENPHQPAARYRRTDRRRARPTGRSRPARRRSRARRSPTTTSSTPRRRRRSRAAARARRASSSSTRTRAGPRSGRRSSTPGRRRSRATRVAPSAASSR